MSCAASQIFDPKTVLQSKRVIETMTHCGFVGTAYGQDIVPALWKCLTCITVSWLSDFPTVPIVTWRIDDMVF